MGKTLKIALAVVLVLIGVQLALALVVQLVLRGGSTASSVVTYQRSDSFVGQLEAGQVSAVTINTKDKTVRVTPTTGKAYTVNYPNVQELTRLLTSHPQVIVTSKNPTNPWWQNFWPIISIILLAVSVLLAISLFRLLRQSRQS